MEKWAFLAIALAEVALFVWVFRIWRKGRAVRVSETLILMVILTGVIYDNTLLAFGGDWFGVGPTHELLSYPRYLMHGLFTPLLIIFCALSADRLNVPGYRTREVITIWGAVTFFAIWFGLIGDLINLQIAPETADGLTSYKHVGELGPPIAEILTVLGMLIIGGAMQRYARWPWVFLSASVMFVIALFFIDNGVLANIGELVLLTGCAATGAEAIRRVTAEREEKKAMALQEAAARRASRSADGVPA
jgi:hypothetical protein